MAKYNITPPDLNECKSYEAYKRELSAWAAVTELAKNKQGNYVVLSLPNKSKFGNDIKERAFESLSEDELRSDDGLKLLLKFLDKELGKNAVDDIIEKWDDFDSVRKTESQTLEEFISDFETKYNRIKSTGTQMPEEILAYMLMKRAGLTHIEKMLILSRIDIEKKDTLFKDVKSSMKNILGKRLQNKNTEDQLKLEPAYLAQHEEALAAHGYYRNRSGTYPSKNNKYQNKGQGYKKQDKSYNQDKSGKSVNPKGNDGKTLLCRSCGSFRHLLAKCPDSYENKKKSSAFVTEEIGSDESDCELANMHCEPENIDRFVLFTSDSDELSRFTSEAINAAALDTCCTTSVAGENWLRIYLESIPKDYKDKVQGPLKGEKWFQFGNQGVLKSKAKYILPATLGMTQTMIEVEIIDSDIPLLLSKAAMKKAGMTIYLSEDAAEVYNQKISLSTTSAGHYVIPLLPSADEVASVDPEEDKNPEEVLVTILSDMDDESKIKALEKLHKQFGHRPKESFVNLLKSANSWTPQMSEMIDKIIDGCEGCIKRKRNPDRPAVAMPMASEFNEKIAIDLSFYKKNIILHMVDMWSRLTVSVLIQRKKPSEVIEGIMQNWVAYFGVPGSILNDNGGEFTAEEIREVKSILNINDLTTGAESPWQNGLCEKNHALLDNILERLDEDYPEIDLQTKLAWAGMAKNSLQMTYGYSPNQLVFGQNPRLPNITTDGPPAWEDSTASEMVAKHLNTLHAARKAFIHSESSSRLKTALKAKIRTNNVLYDFGDIIYYKRIRDNRWMGPAKVVFQDGKIIFVRHGSTYIRVSANRLVKAGEELTRKLMNSEELESEDKVDTPPEIPSGLPEPVDSQENRPLQLQVIEPTQPERIDEEVVHQQEAEVQEHMPQDQQEPRPHVPNRPINLHKNDKIRFQQGSEWREATITGRGKVSGKYKNWFNVAPADGGDHISVDLEAVQFQTLNEQEPVEEIHMVMVPKQDHGSEECKKAKEAELQKLKDFDTYKVVEDSGQERISCTWVLCRKGQEVRARLVARGYEEEEDIQSDSPTLSKAGLRMITAVAASKQWTIQTTDIKSAFLQGSKLTRKVFIKPPKEANVTNQLWELMKALYGLKDASRQWYFRVREKLMKLGCKQSNLDPGMFYKYGKNGKICGMIGLHVDDFLHAGDQNFDVTVIHEVNNEFKVGKNEKQNFIYTGFVFSQDTHGITVNQNSYVENVSIDPVDAKRAINKNAELSDEERTSLRKMAGVLNWIVRGSRPDLSYELIDISTKFKAGKVEDLLKVTKLLTLVKENKAEIYFPDLEESRYWKILCYTDASLGNLNNGTDSTGGYLVFLINYRTGNAAILDWQANKIKRVVRSTLAAETLSLNEGLEASIHLNGILQELIGVTVEVHAVIDNRSVVDAVRSTTTVDDKRLRRDISAVKQMLECGEVKSVTWVPGNRQLADVLTKRGVNGYKLLEVIQTGKIEQEILFQMH